MGLESLSGLKSCQVSVFLFHQRFRTSHFGRPHSANLHRVAADYRRSKETIASPSSGDLSGFWESKSRLNAIQYTAATKIFQQPLASN